MYHWKRATILALVAVVHLMPGAARAWVDIETRCRGDTLTRRVDIDGRNAWALKCGVISQGELQAVQLLDGYYWTLIHMNQDTSRAPVRESAPCASGWVKGTPCRPGCYAETERMLFGGVYQRLPDAYGAQQPTVTALSPDASLDDLKLKEEVIESFTRGPETEALVTFETTSGKRLTVTPAHPMVDERGNVVAAHDVREGTRLLTLQGPEAVTRVQRTPYHGDVWNLRARDTRPKSNVHVAEGFLTGSVRYQAEWASDAARLLLRDSLQYAGSE